MMSWKAVNLEEVLHREKKRQERKSPDRILSAFKEVLAKDDVRDEEILTHIFSNSGSAPRNLDWKKLDPERIYTGKQLYMLCKQYRLRFLSARYFKGDIPYEAVSKVKRLFRDENEEPGLFKVLAPAPMFHLAEKDKDPLLFLSLGEDHYYLVHKWGKDLSIWRKLMVFPFRSFKTLLGCIGALALFTVMLIPDSVIMGPYDSSSLSLRVIFFIYLFIAFSGLTVLYGFSRMKNFNGALWDSHYLE